MMVAIRTASGRLIHVVPDNEPVFTYSEVAGMKLAGYGPEQAELVAKVKEVFQTTEPVEFPTIPHEEKEQLTMAFVGHFNTEEVPESQDYTPLPPGDYPATITASEMKGNAAGTGSYLKMEFTIQGDIYSGRKLFANLNLDNPSQQAVEIARGELRNITIACGKKVIQDSEELHNIPLMLTVGQEKRKDNGELTNKIRKYLPYGGVKLAAVPPPAKAAVAKPPAASPPWAKKAA